jgi:hypothetical protein
MQEALSKLNNPAPSTAPHTTLSLFAPFHATWRLKIRLATKRLKIHKKESTDESPMSKAVSYPFSAAAPRPAPRAPRPAPRSAFRVPRPRSTLHAPRSTLHAPRSTLHAPRSTLHAPRSTLHAPRSTLQAPCSMLFPFRAFSCLFAAKNSIGHKKAQNSQKERR